MDPLDLSRDQVHMEGETVVVTRKVDSERGKSTVNGENRMLVEVVDPEPLTGDHVPFRKETGKSEFMHPCRTLSHFQGKGSDPP
jgi:hypothetical protein